MDLVVQNYSRSMLGKARLSFAIPFGGLASRLRALYSLTRLMLSLQNGQYCHIPSNCYFLLMNQCLQQKTRIISRNSMPHIRIGKVKNVHNCNFVLKFAINGTRGGSSSNASTVGERLLSTLLTEMDGLEQTKVKSIHYT